MCKTIEICDKCPMPKEFNAPCDRGAVAEEAIEAVEKWSAEHPTISNRQKFEEVFGKPPIDYGFKSDQLFCPPCIPYEVCRVSTCELCQEWWNEPYIVNSIE